MLAILIIAAMTRELPSFSSPRPRLSSRLVITVIIYSDSIVIIELSRDASQNYHIINSIYKSREDDFSNFSCESHKLSFIGKFESFKLNLQCALCFLLAFYYFLSLAFLPSVLFLRFLSCSVDRDINR